MIQRIRKSSAKVGTECQRDVIFHGAKRSTIFLKQSILMVSHTYIMYNQIIMKACVLSFYHEVLHGVKAAILDALKQHPGDKLEGSTLYCTLIPDHNDSQMIREVGITRVVYRDDKFAKHAFTIASKKILQGLDWRYITV